MSTPIEIVRAFMDRDSPPHMPGPSYLAVNLAAVLRDAERFKALEQAHEKGEEMEVRVTDGLIGPRGRWCHWSGELSELADRLRKGTK